MDQKTIEIDGMNCGHCVMSVKKALGKLPGVTVEDVKIGSATIHFDAAATNIQAIHKAIADAGFEPRG
jgi:copper chaperone CopZ